MVLLVLGAQGAIRLFLDHTDSGLVGWVPGGFVAWMVVDLAAAVVGSALAARGTSYGRSRAKR
jgi:hypothetical protein